MVSGLKKDKTLLFFLLLPPVGQASRRFYLGCLCVMLSFLEFTFSTSESARDVGYPYRALGSPVPEPLTYRHTPQTHCRPGSGGVHTELPMYSWRHCMPGQWLSPLHPHYPSPALQTPGTLPLSWDLRGEPRPTPPGVSPRARSGPARSIRARIRNHIRKVPPAWLSTSFPCFLVSAQGTARALNPGSHPVALNDAGG